ncbi:head GIN domain-containing protein [Flavobacterium sp. ASW18X]|uniref:head GIN domain-containing protein n=1 Tax=Flavobacterium sp. ASW18X TaxID=2572595 RepID=UPI0010ADE236|nr:head GIN domain-containing protein [Flavobacterium sp. ASW18X]TKD63447.1 DUF2807 domain-containing protein [Flavobacterium sp. ASW18X]
MKNGILVALTCIFTLSAHAQWGKRIKGNGNVVTLERSVNDYDGIAISGWFDVKLVSGSEGELTLKGEENLLDYIITEVDNGVLVIKTEKGVNLKPSSYKNGIYITVPVEEIDELSLSGSGDITSSTTLKGASLETRVSGSGDVTLDVDVNHLEARLSGSGDMDLSGQASNFEVTISGSGDISAYDLTAKNVEATVSGSADIEITVEKSLNARVSGSGNITYKGNPSKVKSKSSGSGDVSRA